MMSDFHRKNISRLSDHKLDRKKGIVATPLNDGLGHLLKLTSWAKERMPEYLWLGLILRHYGRKEGFEKSLQILYEISKSIPSLSHPRLSIVLSLPANDQKKVYEIVCSVIDSSVMSPLTILYRKDAHRLFNEYFFVPQVRVEDRISILTGAIVTYFPAQSFEATDLRFLALTLMLFDGRLRLPREVCNILQEYPNTDHTDELMRMYRPTVRSLEGSMELCMSQTGPVKDNQFNLEFWRDIGMLTPCNLMVIKFDEGLNAQSEFIDDCRTAVEYVVVTNKEKSLADDKFDVIVGSVNYALKIFAEIDSQSLGNSIVGRHAIRTIIEVYIILKYLLRKEPEKPTIWKDYKLYGISKYKLIVLKARESPLQETPHFVLPIADAIVNETMSEEFIDVDLKYFDKQGVREKSIDVGEKELYDVMYDYDSSFSHALWGAIRESAMLHCDNASHQYHCVPDIYSSQRLPDVKPDCEKIMKALFSLLGDAFPLPADFITKYGIGR